MAQTKKATRKKPAAKKDDKMAVTMKEFADKKLHSGSKKGPKVKSRKQAVAIGLSQKAKSSKRPRNKGRG